MDSPIVANSTVSGLSKDLRKRLFISQNARDNQANESENDYCK